MTKNYNLKVFAPVLLLFFLILSGCSGDDDNVITLENFYKGALTSAKTEDLAGIWSIYEVEYEGEKTSVPVSYQGCDRDFFVFMDNGKYSQYAANSEWCNYDTDATNWSLNEGIIYIGPSVPQSEEMVLVGLNKDKLVFRMKIDIDEDGTLDILTFTAQRYAPPNDPDIYTTSFQWDDSPEHQDKIRLKWMKYQGFNKFDKYEIYRAKEGCSKSQAELIGTITDVDQNNFVDETPAPYEKLCYFFKLYTDKGLVGESTLVDIYTFHFEVEPVKLSTPITLNDAIKLDWEVYQGNYFSHYEIVVTRLDEFNINGEEVVLAKIEDINTTTFTDNNPPYAIHPGYTVFVYNIFGQRTPAIFGTNTQKSSYKKPGVLPFKYISFISLDQEETIAYVFTEGDLYRYNYSTQIIEAKAAAPPTSDTTVEMKLTHSSVYGKEIIFHQSGEYNVYDAKTLELKYELKPQEHFSVSYFANIHDNLWIFLDSDYAYTYERDGNTLHPIDKAPTFSTHHGDSNYYPIPLNNNEVLVGHHNESNSIVFTVDNNGNFQNRKTVNLQVKSLNNKLKILYSPEQNFLVDLMDNKIYSSENFTPIRSFEMPRFPSGISMNGNLILGSNNQPDQAHNHDFPPEREVKIYNVSSQTVHSYETEGYPHLLFENHLGQIISISSGFKRHSLYDENSQDIFFEIIK